MKTKLTFWRALGAIAAIALASLGMTACDMGVTRRDDVGGGGSSQGGGSAGNISFAWWGNPLRNQQTAAVLNMFTQQTGIAVGEVSLPWSEYWGRMSAMAAAGNLPDVMQQDISTMLQYHGSNLLIDLRPFIADGRIDTRNIPATVLEQGRIGTGIYGIPMGMGAAAMIYNRTLLDQLGLSAPRNMTLAQFIDLSREVYRRAGVRANWASIAPEIPLHAHLRAQGAQMFERAPGGGWRMGGAPVHYQQFFDVIRQGIDEGWHFRLQDWGGRDRFVLANDPLVYPPNLVANPSRRSWMSVGWSSILAPFQSAAGPATQIGITTIPSANPRASNYARASMLLSMTRDARNQNQAAQLINFFTNHQPAHEIMLGERGVPANAAIANATRSRLPPAAQLQTEFVVWMNQPANSTPFMSLLPDGFSQVHAELRRVTDMVMTGAMTPAAAAQQIFSFGNSVLR